MGLNRRIFLGTLGSAVGGTAMGAAGIPGLTVAAGLVPGFSRDALAATGPAPDTADEYDALRARWRDLVTGTGYDPQAEPFRTRLATIGTEAENARTSMTPEGASLWSDLPLDQSTWNMTLTFRRLRTMALAYVLPATGHTGSSTMAEAAVTGTDYMTTKFYTPPHWWGNWWDWLIGTPQVLNDLSVLLYDELGPERVARHVERIDHFVDPGAIDRTEGANRGWLCEVTAVRGVIGKSAEMLVKARDGLSPVMRYVTEGDGFYRDGSFIQHAWYAYTGSYGYSLLQSVSGLFALLSGSTWEITDPNRQVIFDSIERSFAPFVYNGLNFDAVAGRVPSRTAERDHDRGHLVTAAVIRLAAAGSPEESARWKGIAKGWLQRERGSRRYFDDHALTMAALADGQAVLDDPAVAPVPEPVEHRIFGSMDQATHRRPGWALSISMRSSRTAFYESINGENLTGWHTGVGMTYWWGADFGNDHYTDAFWPTADPYRLPGTTVSRKPLEKGVGNNTLPTTPWAGGSTDGEFAAVGQSIQALRSTLSGRKSWFCLDDAVVCLGAGISCRDGHPIDTTIDQRNLGETGTNTVVVDGQTMPTEPGTVTTDRARWCHLEGYGGYVFPGGTRLHALREDRTGSWRDINTGGPPDPITRRYVTLYLAHGTDPDAASYAYVLMPGADPARTKRRAADRHWLKVLANSADRQAIAVPSLGFVGANFFAAGAVGGLRVDRPASVMVRVADGRATVCVSDPQQNADTVRLTWDRPGRRIGEVLSQDPTVTVVEADRRLVLSVAVDGSAGATHRAVVALRP